MFTHWWKPQGGRWQHSPSFHPDAFFQNLFEREPSGPKCKYADVDVVTEELQPALDDTPR